MSGKLESYDLTKIFSLASLHDITEDEEYEPVEKLAKKSSFPDFGAHLLQRAALAHMCSELGEHIGQALSAVSDVPSAIVAGRMCSVWDRVVDACLSDLYSNANVCRVLKASQKDEDVEASTSGKGSELSQTKHVPEEKLTGNALLMELGIKTGLSVVFSLLKQAWSQLAYQRRLEQVLLQSASLSLESVPAINLPNDVLKSVLDILASIPPLSLSNPKTISGFSEACLNQSVEFLQWVINPSSHVDDEGKRLALQIMLTFYLQRGSLVHFLEWAESILLLLVSYQDVGMAASPPSLEISFCQNLLTEIRMKTVSE